MDTKRVRSVAAELLELSKLGTSPRTWRGQIEVAVKLMQNAIDAGAFEQAPEVRLAAHRLGEDFLDSWTTWDAVCGVIRRGLELPLAFELDDFPANCKLMVKLLQELAEDGQSERGREPTLRPCKPAGWTAKDLYDAARISERAFSTLCANALKSGERPKSGQHGFTFGISALRKLIEWATAKGTPKMRQAAAAWQELIDATLQAKLQSAQIAT